MQMVIFCGEGCALCVRTTLEESPSNSKSSRCFGNIYSTHAYNAISIYICVFIVGSLTKDTDNFRCAPPASNKLPVQCFCFVYILNVARRPQNAYTYIVLPLNRPLGLFFLAWYSVGCICYICGCASSTTERNINRSNCNFGWSFIATHSEGRCADRSLYWNTNIRITPHLSGKETNIQEEMVMEKKYAPRSEKR